MAVPFSREQVELMLSNMHGEALVVLPQSEHDRLVAEASRRTQDVPPWAASEAGLDAAQAAGKIHWFRYEGRTPSRGHLYIVSLKQRTPTFGPCDTREEAAADAAAFVATLPYAVVGPYCGTMQ